MFSEKEFFMKVTAIEPFDVFYQEQLSGVRLGAFIGILEAIKLLPKEVIAAIAEIGFRCHEAQAETGLTVSFGIVLSVRGSNAKTFDLNFDYTVNKDEVLVKTQHAVLRNITYKLQEVSRDFDGVAIAMQNTAKAAQLASDEFSQKLKAAGL